MEMTISDEELDSEETPKHQLDSFRSTAISGNDLMASVLYTTGLVCVASGQLAPISMFLCVVSLYPFVKILQECGTAIPLNGGLYVALLNSTNKLVATFAASCSLIDYAATAVVSAASCTSYASAGFGEFPNVPVTIGILGLFAGLVVFGIKESANVATIIFSIHMITLVVLIVASLVYVIQDNGETLMRNWNSPLPINRGGVGMDIFLGYSISLLGLTGFETSANYIEDIGKWFGFITRSIYIFHTRFVGPFETQTVQDGTTRRKSVFEKTMVNMWCIVFFVNPTIAILTLGVVDLPKITSNTSTILSVVGGAAGGKWLRLLVNIDAIIVLAGGVLTAYVGVNGLIRQLTFDRCLPQFLLHQNALFGTNHWIILSFFILCVSLYMITGGDVTILSGVFAIAFLMVLILFAWANISLKYSRPRLPRGVRASWNLAIIGLATMTVGLIGNVIFDPSYLLYFLIYVGFFFIVIVFTYERLWILKIIWYIVDNNPLLRQYLIEYVEDSLVNMKKFTVLFFTNTSELHILNKAILYARDNECCDRLILAHIKPNGRKSSTASMDTIDMLSIEDVETPSRRLSRDPSALLVKNLQDNLQVLDHMYPKMKIDLLIIEAEGFTPRVVKKLSQDLKIPPSFMFIRCPGSTFRYNIGEYGGVRTIMK